MKRFIAIAFVIVLLTVNTSFSAEAIDEKHDGSNNFWSNFWSYNPTYKFLYDTTTIAKLSSDCKDPLKAGESVSAGRDSVFFVNQRANNDGYDIIEFEDVNKINGQFPANSVEKDIPYKLCKNNDIVPAYSYKRTGGITTGLLVVPFKYRTGGELSGDAAIGPYVGVTGEKFSTLVSLGLSQIAVTDVNTKEVENRTGVTAAAGVNWTIAANFDIAFIVGVDHLSGSAGDDFKFQDKVWGSFGIGYNFTR